ncbi:FAD-dependent oxidoreductase [Nocardia sp. NPDC048505]|uniref:protoporphyrinogen/coproporphyrinogen oxidase n=1 Tax=unclassified Nocardia TaxID=2637762 RepID=UPI0033F8B123
MESSAHTIGKQVAVVGGGISGIAAACRLEQAGYRVDLLEGTGTLGGRCGIDRLGERPVMMGGKNIGHNYSTLRTLLAELGVHLYEPFGINTSRMIDGKLTTLDSQHLFSEMRKSLGRIGSRKDVGKLLYLGTRVKSNVDNRFLGSATFTKIAAKSDHLPLSEHFGPDLTQNLFRPMTVRMNGAEPDEVYLGTFGTNLAMMLDNYDQLTHGIEPAFEALAKRVAVRLNSRVDGLVVRHGRVTGLRVVTPDGPPVEQDYDGVVLAVPAYAAADIVKSELPKLSGVLASVNYFPATVAVVEYERPVFSPAIRAIALDNGPCSNAGVYGVNDLNVVRYTFSGRAARPLPSADQLAEWIDDAEARIQEMLGVGKIDRVRMVTQQWDYAYCGYLPFHGDFLSQVNSQVHSLAGLELAGDYMLGAPLEACARSGSAAARRLLSGVEPHSHNG